MNIVLIGFAGRSGVDIYNVPNGINVPLGAYVACKEGDGEPLMGIAMTPSFDADVKRMASLWDVKLDGESFKGDVVGAYVIDYFPDKVPNDVIDGENNE